jgi:hypothetical protein
MRLPHALGMRAGIVIEVTPEDRRRLDRIVRNRNSLQKHAERARLATADGCCPRPRRYPTWEASVRVGPLAICGMTN